MDARITQLEAQAHRLRADIEDLKTALWLLQERTRTDWFARACLALMVITFVLFGALWRDLGWI